jgi:uncharacterized protein (UPF0264 family)
MQLLVSVRSAAEVEAALSGGADIIDAKEPSHGSLGAVSTQVLREILDRIPSDRIASIALGDMATSDDVLAAVASLSLPRRQAPTYLKLGFAGVSSPEQVRTLLATGVAASRRHATATRVVAVAYADNALARSAAPQAISQAAAVSGAAGVLFDTSTKNGGSLLAWMPPAALTSLIAKIRVAGLMSAVAGGLGLEDLAVVGAAGPNFLGVRGAACDGGREGRVSRARVYQLRRALREADSGFLQDSSPPSPASSRNA